MNVEETSICIIGGGPVGTLLSALLSRNYNIPNIVLERETIIPTDPRAFSMTENGVRCLQSVGLFDKVYETMGQSRTNCVFISGRDKDINAPPFLHLNTAVVGHTGHMMNLMFDQPEMERQLRRVVHESGGDFRTGAEVVGIQETEKYAEVTYNDSKGEHHIRAKFIIGTDGKHGFTRKMYLEPKGIKMEYTDSYEAIYAGGNMNVKTPTPRSHPAFPLWDLGYTPEQVMELFVPEAFHFMGNPDRQCVMSRFGNEQEPMSWRFEFQTLPGEDPTLLEQPDQVRKMLWPYMIHKGSKYGLKQDVAFPDDCLEIRRTWHYKFEARSCTRFHLGRVILAGDAAHVFPPFGGQGITAGFLDVTGLAWRLAIALQNPSRDPTALLNAWEAERRTQIQQALGLTMKQGALFTETNPLKIFLRDWMFWISQRIPYLANAHREAMKAPPAYQYEEGMSFIPDMQGGVSMEQVYVRAADGEVRFSDDVVFGSKSGHFQLVVLVDSMGEVAEAANLFKETSSNPIIEEATYIVHDLEAELSSKTSNVARIASAEDFEHSPLSRGRPPADEYHPHLLKIRHPGRKYILVRPDRFVFAACNDFSGLSTALRLIEKIFYS